MTAFIIFIIFMVVILIGVPVGWAIGFVTAISLALCGGSYTILPSKMITGINSFTYLCIPFFILAANIMSTGGITKRIFLFCDGLIGHVKGGLAHANVLASMFFGGISGAANADAVGLGKIEIELMSEAGYDRPFSSAVTAASAVLSPIVPPSNIFIIYAIAAGNVSVSEMFVGGIIPAAILVAGMIAMNYYFAVKYNHPKRERFCGWRQLWQLLWKTLPALFMPVIILGGITAGIFTATESSVVAGMYAIVVSAFFLRSLKWKDLYAAFVEAAKMTSVVVFIIAMASSMGWGLTTLRIPHMISQWSLSLANTPTQFLLITFCLLTFTGMFLDVAPSILILVPILLPAATAFGIDALRFGLVVSLTLTVGLITPPVGMLLFTTSTVAGISLSSMYKAIIPYAILELIICLIITLVPALTNFLPVLLGYA